jgi:SAM-dependent methyltransferase
MHTIEHIGLGRYGDPIDPEGDIKAAQELKRVLKPGGSFLFVTPMGKKDIIEWNAHRIYTYQSVLNLMDGLTLKEFSLIPEYAKDGGIIINADPELLKKEHYACGCFLFTKIQT